MNQWRSHSVTAHGVSITALIVFNIVFRDLLCSETNNILHFLSNYAEKNGKLGLFKELGE